MASVTIADQSGRTLSGQTLEVFWTSISHAKLLSAVFPYVGDAGRPPGVLDDADPGEETQRLFDDARAHLCRVVEEGWLAANLGY